MFLAGIEDISNRAGQVAIVAVQIVGFDAGDDIVPLTVVTREAAIARGDILGLAERLPVVAKTRRRDEVALQIAVERRRYVRGCTAIGLLPTNVEACPVDRRRGPT